MTLPVCLVCLPSSGLERRSKKKSVRKWGERMRGAGGAERACIQTRQPLQLGYNLRGDWKGIKGRRPSGGPPPGSPSFKMST